MLQEQICQMLALQPKAHISAFTFQTLTCNSFFFSWNIFQKPESPLNLGHLRKVANINVGSLTTASWMRCVLYLWRSEYDRLFQKTGWRIRVFESGKLHYFAELELAMWGFWLVSVLWHISLSGHPAHIPHTLWNWDATRIVGELRQKEAKLVLPWLYQKTMAQHEIEPWSCSSFVLYSAS